MPEPSKRRPRSAQQLGMRIAGSIHRVVYRLSSGRVGRTMGGMPVLLLTTIGRKTGLERTWPVGYIVDGNRLVVVAAALGQAAHPAWYLNLQTTPRVLVSRSVLRSEMTAETASGVERARLWSRLVHEFP